MINNSPTTSGYSLATSPRHGGQERRHYETHLDFETTIAGFVYQGGIVICADSTITQGNVMMSESILKAFPVNDLIMAMMAGKAGECSNWIRTLVWHSTLHELNYDEPLPLPSAATTISNMTMKERSSGWNLCMGMILAGRDKSGFRLFRIDSEGFIQRGTIFAVGSGSDRAIDILDNNYNHNFTDKQAFDLGFRAVYCALKAKGTLGGSVSLQHISTAAWKTETIMNSMELHLNFRRNLNYAGEHIEEDIEPQPPKRLKMSECNS